VPELTRAKWAKSIELQRREAWHRVVATHDSLRRQSMWRGPTNVDADQTWFEVPLPIEVYNRGVAGAEREVELHRCTWRDGAGPNDPTELGVRSGDAERTRCRSTAVRPAWRRAWCWDATSGTRDTVGVLESVDRSAVANRYV
jgi:hypothetical protein